MDGEQVLFELSQRLEKVWDVPPLIRGEGKHPIDRRWTSGPREDPRTWRRRLVGWKGNVGMLTGHGLVVVDGDLYVSGAQDSLDRLHDLGLPRGTVTSITGGGGQHLFYCCDRPVRSAPLEGYPGIDIKGEGGMVIVPPSIHESGRPYEWEYTWDPWEAKRAELTVTAVGPLDGQHHERPLDQRDEVAVNLLLDHLGGHSPQQRNHWVEVTRPGKEKGSSATVGAVGAGVTKVWSSHWEGLPAGVYGLAELRRVAGVEGPKVHVPELEPDLVLPDGYRLWRSSDGRLPARCYPTRCTRARWGSSWR